MKVIFSRKGFDSSYGGFPSIILPDGQMISFPIPEKGKKIGAFRKAMRGLREILKY